MIVRKDVFVDYDVDETQINVSFDWLDPYYQFLLYCSPSIKYTPHHELSNVDSVRSHSFKLTDNIRKKMSKYSHYNYYYAIPMEYACYFLDAMIPLTAGRVPKLVIRRYELESIIDHLIMKKFLSKESGREYLDKIQSFLTRNEYAALVRENKDFHSACTFAYFLRKKQTGDLKIDSQAFNWLKLALEFKPNNINFSYFVNLNAFLASYTQLDATHIIKANNHHFLNALVKNKTITHLYLEASSLVSVSNDINQSIKNYLIETDMLNRFIIGDTSQTKMYKIDNNGYWKEVSYYIDCGFVESLAVGLRYNRTLRELSLTNLRDDKDIILILNAIRSNPDSKIERITLIADKRDWTVNVSSVLEDLLYLNRTIIQIDVPAYRDTTNVLRLIQRNKDLREKCTQEKEILFNTNKLLSVQANTLFGKGGMTFATKNIHELTATETHDLRLKRGL